jgi:hypothetical protein
VFHTHNPLFAPPLPVLTFIRGNVENVRGYQNAGRCSFFNKLNLLLMIKRAQTSSSENHDSLLGQAKGLLG